MGKGPGGATSVVLSSTSCSPYTDPHDPSVSTKNQKTPNNKLDQKPRAGCIPIPSYSYGRTSVLPLCFPYAYTKKAN